MARLPGDLIKIPVYRFDGLQGAKRASWDYAELPAKGKEYIHELASRGGLASGKTRWLKRVGKIIAECARKLGIDLPATPDDGYSAAVHSVWETTGWLARQRLALPTLPPLQQHQELYVRRMRNRVSVEWTADAGGAAGAGEGASDAGVPQEVRASSA
jgi:hypothetical protein